MSESERHRGASEELAAEFARATGRDYAEDGFVSVIVRDHWVGPINFGSEEER